MSLSSELQNLSDTYDALRRKLFDCGGASTRHPAELVLASEELIRRVGQLNQRVSDLAAVWREQRGRLDPARRAEIQALAAGAAAQLRQLQRTCGAHARKLDDAAQQMSRELGQVERGARYLASVRPVKTNIPKFVDSTG